MLSTFFSYSSKNQQLILNYEKALTDTDTTVWRDKTSLHAGEFWPMRLGEAIAEHDVFILFWSAEAKDSHFVTLEWNTALALHKRIIPVLLDSTPLPASLKARHSIKTTDQLKHAIHQPGATSHKTSAVSQANNNQVIKQLKTAQGDLDKALSLVTTHINQTIQHQSQQNQWEVQGNVYQVEGDLHISPNPNKLPDRDQIIPQTNHYKWGGYAIVIVLLVITSILFLKPTGKTNNEKATHATTSTKLKHTLLTTAGMVQDAQGNLLANVIISLPDYGLETKTNSMGRFSFTLKDGQQQSTRLYAKKAGYRPWNDYINLGDNNFRFIMQKL